MKDLSTIHLTITIALAAPVLLSNCGRKASETANEELPPDNPAMQLVTAASEAPSGLPKKVAEIEQPININGAALEELMLLPRIGSVTAQKILEGRPYTGPEDLLKVSGIGEKTLEGILPYILVGEVIEIPLPAEEPATTDATTMAPKIDASDLASAEPREEIVVDP